jgi:hypothetical protein
MIRRRANIKWYIYVSNAVDKICLVLDFKLISIHAFLQKNRFFFQQFVHY